MSGSLVLASSELILPIARSLGTVDHYGVCPNKSVAWIVSVELSGYP